MNHSHKKSLKSTGPKLKSFPISGSLLPTPTTLDAKARDYYSKGDLAIGGVIKSFTYSRAASPASPSQSPDEERERKMTAFSGERCLGLFGSLDHDGSLLRMCRDLLLSGEDWYSSRCALNWKEKVTPYKRSLFQLSPSMRLTEGTGYGLLPTARAGKTTSENLEVWKKRNRDKKVATPPLALAITMLPTPRSSLKNGPSKKEIKEGDPKGRIETQIGMRTGLRLQPDFAGWMMGYPQGYLDLEDGEMPRSKRTGTVSSRRSQRKSLKQSKK